MIGEGLGDLAMRRGALEEAAAHYAAAPGHAVSDGMARRLQIKLLGTHDPELARLVTDYFAPFAHKPRSPADAALRSYVAVQIRERHPALGFFLLGQLLLDARDGPRAAAAFEQALEPIAGPPLPTPELIRGAREGLLTATVRARDYDRARAVLGELLGDPSIGNGDRYTYRLWSERIDFFVEHRPEGSR